MTLHTILCVVLTLAAERATSAPISVPVTKDNSIVLVDGEWTENSGQKWQIHIQGNQHLFVGFSAFAPRGEVLRPKP